jgi:hypothetical protein
MDYDKNTAKNGSTAMETQTVHSFATVVQPKKKKSF